MIKVGLTIVLVIGILMFSACSVDEKQNSEPDEKYSCEAQKFGNGIVITERQKVGMPISSLKLTIDSQKANMSWDGDSEDLFYSEDHVSGLEIYITEDRTALIMIGKDRKDVILDMGTDGKIIYECKKEG